MICPYERMGVMGEELARIREQRRDEGVRREVHDQLFPIVEADPFEGFVNVMRNVMKDVGMLVAFLIFVVIASAFLSERALFYILCVILLSILVINADRVTQTVDVFIDIIR